MPPNWETIENAGVREISAKKDSYTSFIVLLKDQQSDSIQTC